MDDEILTVDEAAGLLKVSSEIIVSLLMTSELAGRNVGGEWRTTKRALVNFVDGISSQTACCGPGMCCTPNRPTASQIRAASDHNDG